MNAAQQTLLDAPKDALFICNHSGGKDSQAMFKWMYDNLDHNRMLVIHAHLPGAEWEGTLEHIQKTARNIPVHVVTANKTFFEMVLHRGMFPSPKIRQCTSDLKTQPIAKFIRNYAKEHGYHLIYNCIGLRAQESNNRSKLTTITINKKLTTKSRIVYNALPIHHYDISDVFNTYGVLLNQITIRRKLYQQGLKKEALQGWPFIWTYIAGMSRHSCKICIMSSLSDLKCSSRIDPQNFERYINLENSINHKFIMPSKYSRSLSDIASSNETEQLDLSF